MPRLFRARGARYDAAMRLYLLAAVPVLGLAPLLVSACSEDNESECSQDSECGEVVCADGTKIRSCVNGECVSAEACNQDGGGW